MEVAALLSNAAGVGADLAGLGSVIDYEATARNTDETESRDQQKAPPLITGSSQKVNKHWIHCHE